ncbi:hypothetical protein HTS61_09830 [Escherichia coli]|nr:hypothetical protein [Escherichia coli]
MSLATLFRRKYYENGAHAGYIMYVTDAVQDRNDIEMLREKHGQVERPQQL